MVFWSNVCVSVASEHFYVIGYNYTYGYNYKLYIIRYMVIGIISQIWV